MTCRADGAITMLVLTTHTDADVHISILLLRAHQAIVINDVFGDYTYNFSVHAGRCFFFLTFL